MSKDIQGLYFQGKLIATNYIDAVKALFELKEIPIGFCINEDYEALGWSIVSENGVQNVYELSPILFYKLLQKV